MLMTLTKPPAPAPTMASPNAVELFFLIQSNCQAVFGKTVDVDIVSQLDLLGTWHAHVLVTYGGERSPVYSATASTLQGAVEQLHRCSAMAVNTFLFMPDFSTPNERGEEEEEEEEEEAPTLDGGPRGGGEESLPTGHLGAVSVDWELSPSSGESENEDDTESVIVALASNDSLESNGYGGSRPGKLPRTPASQAGLFSPACAPVLKYGITSLSCLESGGAASASTTPLEALAPTSVCASLPLPPDVDLTAEFCWQGTWSGAAPSSTAPHSAAAPYPGQLPRSGALLQGLQAQSSNDEAAQGGAYHQQQQQQQQSLSMLQRILPALSSVMLCIRWRPHGEATVLDECPLSVRAVQRRTQLILYARGRELLQGLIPQDVTPAALRRLCTVVRKLSVGGQEYVLGPGCQDDLSALRVEPPQFLRFEVEVEEVMGGR